jgi:hypothetical protein
MAVYSPGVQTQDDCRSHLKKTFNREVEEVNFYYDIAWGEDAFSYYILDIPTIESFLNGRARRGSFILKDKEFSLGSGFDLYAAALFGLSFRQTESYTEVWRDFKVRPFEGKKVTGKDLVVSKETKFWDILNSVSKGQDKIYFFNDTLLLYRLSKQASYAWHLRETLNWSLHAQMVLSLLKTGEVPAPEDFIQGFNREDLERLQIHIDERLGVWRFR